MSIRLSSVKYEVTTISSNVATISSNVYSITTSSMLSLSGNLVVGGNLSILGDLQTKNYHCTLTLSTTSTLSGSDITLNFNSVSDPNNWYSSATKKVTPTVAGWYNVFYQLKFNPAITGSGYQWNIQIIKNNTTTVGITQSEIIGDVGRTLVTQALVYLNGSTDYVSAQAYASNTTTLAVDPGWSRFEIYRIH